MFSRYAVVFYLLSGPEFMVSAQRNPGGRNKGQWQSSPVVMPTNAPVTYAPTVSPTSAPIILFNTASPVAYSPSATTTQCTTKLVWVEGGESTTCSDYGTNEDRGHFMPLLDSPTDCYAWTGTGHENSASNIRCSADGLSVLYDQYAGNLDCSGSPVAKSYVLNECHQGRPLNLYDMGIDLSCCSNPEGEQCKNNLTGAPRNARSSALFINGEQCN